MNPEIVLQALSNLWYELPSLFGAAWVTVYPQLEAALADLETADMSAEQTAALTIRLVQLFQPYPGAASKLKAEIRDVEAGRSITRGDDSKGSPPVAVTRERVKTFKEYMAPPSAIRYTDILAPSQIGEGQRDTITVRLTCQPEADSISAQPVVLSGQQQVEVHLRSLNQDVLDILDSPLHRLTIQSGQDTDPVTFYVRGRKPGQATLALSFSEAGNLRGTVQIVVEVVPALSWQKRTQTLATSLSVGGPYVPPPDLDLYITHQMRDGGIVLHYTLHSPNNVADHHYQRFSDKFIPGCVSPLAYQQRLMDKLEAYSHGRDEDGLPLKVPVTDKIKGLGRALYDELFPSELRNAYRRFRNQVTTLQITSDEPWIPWELVSPYDGSDVNQIIDDDFLCLQFQLTRWLAGSSGGVGQVRVQQLACVEAGDVLGQQKLPHAAHEYAFLQKFAVSRGVADTSPSLDNTPAVLALFEKGGVGLWHFATHGAIKLQHPGEAMLIMADGGALRANDIHGPRQQRLSVDRPLIFLNACLVGQQGWGLTQLDGWASALVQRGHCGAFVGPLWSVTDRLAHDFARFFYEALAGGRTVGQAIWDARNEVRKAAPENPTWLAYSVYAHPNARVLFQKGI